MISDENLHSLPKSLRLCVCEVFQYVTPDRNNSALTVVMKPNKVSPSKTFNNSWLSGSKTQKGSTGHPKHQKKIQPADLCKNFIPPNHPTPLAKCHIQRGFVRTQKLKHRGTSQPQEVWMCSDNMEEYNQNGV